VTDHTVTISSNRAIIDFRPDTDAEYAWSDNPFRLEIALQPSGAALIEGRIGRDFYSTYEDSLVRSRQLDNRMYAGDSRHTLLDDEIELIVQTAKELRKQGQWNARYAPGADFRGHDIMAIDGLGDFNVNK
jgi:hypothetical protein